MSASSMKWVVRRTTLFLHFSFNKDHRRRREYGSIPLVGSSKMTTLKVRINTWASNLIYLLFSTHSLSLRHSRGTRIWKGWGFSSYLLGVKKTVLVPLRVCSLNRSTAGVSTVSFRVLSQTGNMGGDQFDDQLIFHFCRIHNSSKMCCLRIGTS